MRVKKAVKRVTIFVALAFTIYACYHLLHGADIRMPSLFRPASGPRVVMSIDGFKFSQSENGLVSWQMDALSADLYEDKEARLRDIVIVFHKQPRGAVTLLGESGTLDTTTGNASLHRGSKDVRVVTNDGYLLTTNSLYWRAGERIIRTVDPFKVLGREIYLEGRGLVADVDIRKLKVGANVKAVLQE